MSLRIPVLAGVAVLSLTGCPSVQSVQTAETVGEGNFQFAIEPGVIGVASSDGSGFVPTVNLSARYGITDRFDLGGRFGTSLIELHAKYQFTDPALGDDVQVALAPQFGGIFLGGGGGSGGYGWLNVPVLIDVPVRHSDLVIGPRVMTIFAGGGDSTTGGVGAIFLVGSSIGYAARVGNTARVLPELAVVYPIAGSVSAGLGGETGFFNANGALYTFNVGILLGGREAPGPTP